MRITFATPGYPHSGEELAGSPFQLYVRPARVHLPACVFTGDGLEKAVSGVKATFRCPPLLEKAVSGVTTPSCHTVKCPPLPVEPLLSRSTAGELENVRLSAEIPFAGGSMRGGGACRETERERA
eukprot:7378790-Pyramimonas_sp.AAC.1